MEKITCISCGHEFTGNFCPNCGEKVIRSEDRKLKHFLAEFINALTFADSKFWRTFKYILLKPGKFSRDFIDGKRQVYMKPLSVFFFANLIYFLFPLFNTFNNSLSTQIRNNNFIHSSLASEMVENRIAEREITMKEYAIAYNVKTSELSKLFLIVMAVAMSLFFSIIHFRKRLLLADHLVLSLELMTFVILFAVQLQGGIVYFLYQFDLMSSSNLINETIVTSVFAIMLIYFFIKMEVSFYKVRRWSIVLNTFLCFLSFTITLFAYRAFLFFVTFWST